MAEVSLVLAVVCGLATAIPGILPAAAAALVTWSRVLSGVGWLGYAGGALVLGGIPDEILWGVLLAQAGYALAVLAIARQSCAEDE